MTPRPQTTRRRILGIRNDADAQILLIDTPGLHEPHRTLNRRMVDTARRCLAEGEVIVAVIAGNAKFGAADRALLAELAAAGRPVVIALNKIDLTTREQLMPLVQELHDALPAGGDRAGQRTEGRERRRTGARDQAAVAGKSGADAGR